MKRISLIFILFVLLSSSICGCSRQEEKWKESEYDVEGDEGNREEKEKGVKTETKDQVSKEEGSFAEEENFGSYYVEKNEELSIVEGYVIVNGKLLDKFALVDENLIVNEKFTTDKEDVNVNLWGKSLYGNGYLTLSYHYIKDGKIYKLNDFYKEVKMFDIASSGNGIAYYTEDNTITLLNVQSETVEKIECVRGNLDYGVVVSPDGETVAYCNGKSIYMYRQGKMEEVYTHYSDGYIGIICIADDGENVFYYELQSEDKSTVWCKTKGKETKKVVSLEDGRAFITNNKNTQIGVYDMSESGMNLYIYDTESETLNKINCIKGCYPVAGYTENMSRSQSEQFIAKALVSSYDTNELLECYYGSGKENGRSFYSGLYYIENYEMKELVSSRINRLSVLSDNRWLCLDEMQRLFVFEEGKKEIVIHEGCVSFSIGNNHETIYFLTRDGELYKYAKDEKQKIASDVIFSVSCPISVVGNEIVIMQCKTEGVPAIFGGEYYIYQDGAMNKVDGSIEYKLYETNLTSSYVNPSMKIMDNNGTYGRFFTTSYLPYMQEGELYVLYGDGKREHITRE